MPMSATVEKIAPNRAKLTFTITPEVLEIGLNKAYLKNKGKFNIPGFRKGKAPKKVIEQHYGEMIFFEDAFDIVFPEEYYKAVDENELFTVSRPTIDIAEVDLKTGVVVVAEVDLKPEIELKDYTGVEVTKQETLVTDEDIDKEIERLRDQNAGFVTAEREAKDGDRVVIDYSGSIDGVKFDGGTAENQTLNLGSKMFIPGFEEQVCGMIKDEEKDITVPFPEDYQAEELAGKDAVFHVSLHEVKEKQLPELDDEFAKDVSEFETLEELKADTKNKLAEQKEKRAKALTEDNVIKAVLANNDFDVPDSMIENQIDMQIEDMSMNLMYQGLKLEDYLAYSGMDMKSLREQQRENAKEMVKTRLILDALIVKEDISADEAEVLDFIAKMAERAKKDVEEYKKTIGEAGMEDIYGRLKFEAAIKFLVDNAKIVEAK